MKYADWALFFLRLGVGIIFAAHGLQKLAGAFGGPGIPGVTEMMKGLGFTSPLVWAWILAVSETLGGIFLFLGILPRFSAAVIAVVMIVAIMKVHLPNGFFMSQKGFEYQFLILMVCLSIIIMGAGRFSAYNKL